MLGAAAFLLLAKIIQAVLHLLLRLLLLMGCLLQLEAHFLLQDLLLLPLQHPLLLLLLLGLSLLHISSCFSLRLSQHSLTLLPLRLLLGDLLLPFLSASAWQHRPTGPLRLASCCCPQRLRFQRRQ
jgi:hypothetical protein